MSETTCYRLLAATTLVILAVQSPAGISARQTRRPEASPLNQPVPAHPSRDYGKLPLAFEPNVGQTDARVRFLARGGGMTTFFTDTETVMVLSRAREGKNPESPGRPEPAREREQAVVRMKLKGAGRPLRTSGLEKLPGVSNYFIGNDPAKWHMDVPHFGRIQSEGVYPGIDLVWYGNQQRLEYDFLVAPGADPKQIEVAYDGVESLQVEAGGDLVLRTVLGEMRQQKPRVYQEVDGKQIEVGSRYALVARNRVSFALGGYDRTRPLRIDPVVLVYSTYLGGSGFEVGYGIAVDGAGSAYVTGATQSTDFPTQSAYQATLQGGVEDAFVTKLTPAGNALVYSTYFGGNNNDYGVGIAVDGAGSAYVTGTTSSTNFPTQSPYQATRRGSVNAFVTKLTPAGNALVYSTYLGGTEDYVAGIAVDGAGSAYVTGQTYSTNFPTQSAYQATFQGGAEDAFVTKLTPAGNALVYSTYLGGNGRDLAAGIAVDMAGSAYVTGSTNSDNFPTQSPYQATLQGGVSDAFVTKLTPAGNALVYSTYLGGSSVDGGRGIAVDGAGSAYVTGNTGSANFPLQSPYQPTFKGASAFVTKLTPVGNGLVYSTYLGGSGGDSATGIAVDGAGSAYVTGIASSLDFPTQSPYQATFQGGIVDAFVTKLTPASNTLVYSTYLGGSGDDAAYGIAVDGAGVAYITGYTQSTNFPTQSPYQATIRGSQNAFVTKPCTPTVSPTSLGAAGTNGTLTLTLNSGSCGWTATSNVPWLTPAATSGTSGTLSVTVGANTSGAQRTGTITVAGQTVTVTQAVNNPLQVPALVSLNPFQGTGPNATLTFVYSHPSGWAALQSAEFIINPRWEANARGSGCYIKYAPGTGLFTLIADDGTSIAGTTAPGSATNIANSQCTLNAASSSVSGNGNTLTVVASLTFQPSFGGQRHIWMQAVDYNNLSTNWLVYGVWFPTQATVTATPWYRIYDPFSNTYLYSADQNEYNTLGARGFTLQGTSGLVMNGSTTVGGVSNMAWYRVFVNSTSSHLWTSDRNEFLTLINTQYAYVGEGVAAFVMPYLNAQGQISPQVTNTIPFYRAAFQGRNLHFWTADADEYFGRNGKQLPAGYFGEGIASYIFPASGAQFSSVTSVEAEPLELDDGSPSVISVLHGASYTSNGVIAPGQVLSIYGRHLGGAVLLNGVPAEVIAARDNEIRIVAPNELAGASEVSLVVERRGRRSKPLTLSVVAANPAIFVNTPYGRGNAQARNEDGAMNDAEHPAARGSVVTLDTTGFAAGNLPVEAHVGGRPAEVISTQVSAIRAGVIEVQVRVPDMVDAGPFQPVVLHVGNLFSQPGVGLAIR